ncbi:MAG: hypothetical protein WBB65_09230 [Anaerolineales bacterium]
MEKQSVTRLKYGNVIASVTGFEADGAGWLSRLSSQIRPSERVW